MEYFGRGGGGARGRPKKRDRRGRHCTLVSRSRGSRTGGGKNDAHHRYRQIIPRIALALRIAALLEPKTNRQKVKDQVAHIRCTGQGRLEEDVGGGGVSERERCEGEGERREEENQRRRHCRRLTHVHFH